MASNTHRTSSWLPQCCVALAALCLAQCGKEPAVANAGAETTHTDQSVGSGEAAAAKGALASNPTVIDSAKIPTPLVFDRRAKLEFDDDPEDPIFNFYSRGTIDLLICPSEATGTLASEDTNYHQALVSCADGEDATRYGLYLLGDLDGIGFWNGSDWWRIDYDFEPNLWVHLTAVFSRGWLTIAVNGAAIGVVRAPVGLPLDPTAPPKSRKLRFCKTYVGGTFSGHDGFLGRMAWVRSWRVALSMDDVARLPGIVGIPEDPVLAQGLGATSSFTEESQSMVRTNTATRAGIAEAAKGTKLEQPFYKDTTWLFDLEQAKQVAAGSGRRILAWCTRGDTYDSACLAIEGGLLGSELWSGLDGKFVPLLLVADATNPKPSGVALGNAAILGADGNVRREFQPWDSAFVLAIDREITERDASSGDERTARDLLLLPAAGLSDAQRQQLRSIAAKSKLPDDLLPRIEDAERIGKIVDLQTRFAKGEKFGPAGGEPLPFAEAQPYYGARAVELFADLALPLEPDARLADYAALLWQGLVDDPSIDLATDALNFLVPMRSLDPVVDAAMAANPMPLDFGLEPEEMRKVLEGK